jgi:hypothetical protein
LTCRGGLPIQAGAKNLKIRLTSWAVLCCIGQNNTAGKLDPEFPWNLMKANLLSIIVAAQRTKLLAYGVTCIVGLVVLGCVTSLPRATTEAALPAEVARASTAFKTGWPARLSGDYAVPRTLLPWLKNGMTKKDVERLLGSPDKASDDWWFYTLFYSMFIEVHFGAEGNVVQIGSPLLGDGKPAPQP